MNVQAHDFSQMKHHRHDVFWLDEQFSKLPLSLHSPIQCNYGRTFEQQGRQAANLYLLSVMELTAGKRLLVQSDSALRSKAHRMARVGKGISMAKAEALLKSVGLPFPTAQDAESALARIACPLWWSRALRKQQDREQEQLAVQVGLVRKGRQPYVTTALLERMQARHQASLEILANYEAISSEGDKVNLLEVLKKSVANPKIRRMELEVRMRGSEAYATEQGHVAMFYTLTTPSKYHRYSGEGLNPKYEHATPREAQAYLVKIWSQIRAKLKREGINVYGFRVAEPHHDGTPHWHILLFMQPEHQSAVTTTLKHYAFLEDGQEAGAAEHRFEAIAIDRKRGSATSYISKYISKNIDGFGMETELDGETAGSVESSAARVRAWASAWGIRQFQQIGGAAVGVWRELIRMENAVEGLLEQARLAVHGLKWGDYLKAQGGATLNRQFQPIKVWSMESVEMTTGALKASRYGETVKRTKGLDCVGAITMTRTKEWTIQPIAAKDAVETQAAPSSSVFNFLQAASLPSSLGKSLNNCTQVTEQDAPAQVKPLKFYSDEEELCWLEWQERRKAAGEPDYPDLYALQERAAIRAESLLTLVGGAV